MRVRELKRRLKVQRSQGDGLAGVGVGYIRDENGKLVKKRTAQPDDIYVTDENGELVPYEPPGPRRFTEEDQARCDRARARRHTRVWYDQTLEAFIEGRLTMTKEQYHALITYGRFKGWHRRPSAKR